MINKPLMGHAQPPDVAQAFDKAMWEHIRGRKTARSSRGGRATRILELRHTWSRLSETRKLGLGETEPRGPLKGG